MSDEQSFLDALKANPADDTARLVYADGLDEHGEPAKAEYLRRVGEWVAVWHTAGPEASLTQRLIDLSAGLPGMWVTDVGGRFELLLGGTSLTGPTAVSSVLQRGLGLGGGAAAVVSEHLPAVV